MRLAITALDCPNNVGGPTTWVRRIAPALAARGVEPVVLFQTWGDESQWTVVGALRKSGIRCEINSGRYTEDAVRETLRVLGDIKPAAYVPNAMLEGYYAARWVRAAGIPTVGVMHSDDPQIVGGFADRFVRGPEEWRLSAYVCVSRYLLNLFAGMNPAGLPAACIPCGVPVRDRVAARPGTELRLVYAGRLADEQKRITDTVRGLCAAVAAVPGASCDIFGDGPQRADVERILAAAGQGLPIAYRGLLPPDELAARSPDYHGFVLLSDYEGQPIALMEAMAAGVVPICTRIRSGVPELVTDGETGLYVDDRGPALTAAVRTLKDDPDLWDRLSAGARQRINDGYSIDATADAWVRFLTDLPSTANRSPIRIPKRIQLPPRHITFTKAVDYRDPGPLGRLYRRCHAAGSRVRRLFVPRTPT